MHNWPTRAVATAMTACFLVGRLSISVCSVAWVVTWFAWREKSYRVPFPSPWEYFLSAPLVNLEQTGCTYEYIHSYSTWQNLADSDISPPLPPSKIKISAVPYLLKCIEVCESMLYHICKDNLLQVHHLEQQILHSSLKKSNKPALL